MKTVVLALGLVWATSTLAQPVPIAQPPATDAGYAVQDPVSIPTSGKASLSAIIVRKPGQVERLPTILFYTTYDEGPGDAIFGKTAVDHATAVSVLGGYAPGCQTRSADPTLTVLDGGNFTPVFTVLKHLGAFSIDNLTIQRGHGAFLGGGLAINSGAHCTGTCYEADVLVSRVIFQGNHTDFYCGGLYASATGHQVRVQSSLFVKNDAELNDGGVCLVGTGNLQFFGNTVADNTTLATSDVAGGLYCGGTGTWRIGARTQPDVGIVVRLGPDRRAARGDVDRQRAAAADQLRIAAVAKAMQGAIQGEVASDPQVLAVGFERVAEHGFLPLEQGRAVCESWPVGLPHLRFVVALARVDELRAIGRQARVDMGRWRRSVTREPILHRSGENRNRNGMDHSRRS